MREPRSSNRPANWDAWAAPSDQAPLARLIVFDASHDQGIEAAQPGLVNMVERLTGKRSFLGDEALDRDLEVRAAFDYLRYVHPAIQYAPPPSPRWPHAQPIRSPGQVRAAPRATCIDLACLLASMLLRNHHQPLVAVFEVCEGRVWSPVHAMLAWWADHIETRRPVWDVERLEGLAEHEQAALRFVEPTFVCVPDHLQPVPRFFEDAYFVYTTRGGRLCQHVAGLVGSDPGRVRLGYAVDVCEVMRAHPEWGSEANGPRCPATLADAIELLHRHRGSSWAGVLQRAGALPIDETWQAYHQVLAGLLDEVRLALGSQERRGLTFSDTVDRLERRGVLEADLANRLRRAASGASSLESSLDAAERLVCDVVGWWARDRPA